jgi:hypothetical protein
MFWIKFEIFLIFKFQIVEIIMGATRRTVLIGCLIMFTFVKR